MERLLVARLKLEALAERGDWDGAVRVGRHALLLASADAGALDGEGCTAPSLPRRAGAGHQPKDTAWHCAVGLDEIARVLAAISKLGIAVQSIDSGSDVSADLRQLLGRVLGSAAAEPKTLTIAAEALKRASGHDFTVWCQHALPKLDEPPRLPLLRAAIDVADAAGTVMLATSAGAEAAVRNGLRSRSSAHRAHTFAILRDMVCAAPHQLASRIFPLKTAVLVEEPPLRYLALAALLDATTGLAIAPAAGAPQSAATHLEEVLSWVPYLLYVPSLPMQTLTGMGLARILLFSDDTSLLHVAVDPECLVSALAYRYTATDDELIPAGAVMAPDQPAQHARRSRPGKQAPGQGAGTDDGSTRPPSVTHPPMEGRAPTAAELKAWPLLPVLATFFVEVRRSPRHAVLANSIAWVILEDISADAAEGTDGVCVSENNTAGCLRDPTYAQMDGEPGTDTAERGAARPPISVSQPWLKARCSRCVRFLAAGLSAHTIELVVESVRANVEEEAAVLGKPVPSPDTVRLWLGVGGAPRE